MEDEMIIGNKRLSMDERLKEGRSFSCGNTLNVLIEKTYMSKSI